MVEDWEWNGVDVVVVVCGFGGVVGVYVGCGDFVGVLFDFGYVGVVFDEVVYLVFEGVGYGIYVVDWFEYGVVEFVLYILV